VQDIRTEKHVVLSGLSDFEAKSINPLTN
jgi:hypothetical protein